MKQKIKKEQKLGALKETIIKSTLEETWFYPEYNEVKGWLGIQDIMFVGPNPSFNKKEFPTKYTDFFYNQLKKNGFENAHLTDLIKVRATNKEADKIIDKYFNRQIKFFKKEIEITKPKIIVIMGKRAIRALQRFGYKDKRFHSINHYSSIRFPNNESIFIEEMKNIRKNHKAK